MIRPAQFTLRTVRVRMRHSLCLTCPDPGLQRLSYATQDGFRPFYFERIRILSFPPGLPSELSLRTGGFSVGNPNSIGLLCRNRFPHAALIGEPPPSHRLRLGIDSNYGHQSHVAPLCRELRELAIQHRSIEVLVLLSVDCTRPRASSHKLGIRLERLLTFRLPNNHLTRPIAE